MQGFTFGRFDPIHNGHMELIKRSLEYVDDLVIYVGRKTKSGVGRDKRREIVKKAVEKYENVHVYESNLKLPEFISLNKFEWIFMGSDVYYGLCNDNRYKPWEKEIFLSFPNIGILEREKYKLDSKVFGCTSNNVVRIGRSPPISSTEIRKRIKEGKDISAFVPVECLELILKHYSHLKP